jgi:uncharacterized protein (TIGR03085 family)
MTGIARRERTAMLELARTLGPDAPTLCEGWTTHDLIAHLWVREHEPAAGPGLVIPALHGITARREAAARARMAYPDLLAAVAAPAGIFALAEDAMNLHECFVHHEDIRRANGLGPRPTEPELADALWRGLRRMAPIMFRRAKGLSVELERPDGATINARPFTKGPRVVVRGEVTELFLLGFNRKSAADVTYDGDPGDVARLRSTPIGL